MGCDWLEGGRIAHAITTTGRRQRFDSPSGMTGFGHWYGGGRRFCPVDDHSGGAPKLRWDRGVPERTSVQIGRGLSRLIQTLLQVVRSSFARQHCGLYRSPGIASAAPQSWKRCLVPWCASVSEPHRRLGDYRDTISLSQRVPEGRGSERV
jgi:hypothetical protein